MIVYLKSSLMICAGAQVPMWIRKGGFHFPSVEKPLILVGPGTGCAPFRSILWQRSADQQKNHCSGFNCLLLRCPFNFEIFIFHNLI